MSNKESDFQVKKEMDETSSKKKTKTDRKIVDYNSSDEDAKDVKKSKDTKDFKIFDVQQAKDYYCTLCRAQMNSDTAWDMHINGKRHRKKVQAANLTAPRRIMPQSELDSNHHQIKTSGGPQIIPTRPLNELSLVQKQFENSAEPAVGLDFVKEIWLSEEISEPVYFCSMCQADCQYITITSHVIGYRHRLQYLKLKDPAKYEWFSNSTSKKSYLSDRLAQESAKLQKIYGKGIIGVAIQDGEEVTYDGDVKMNDTSNDSSSSSEDLVVEKQIVFTPKPEVKKTPKLTESMKVKGLSSDTVRNKFETVRSDSSRLEICKNFESFSNQSVENKPKELEALLKMKDAYIDGLFETSSQEQIDKWLQASFEGDFSWSMEIAKHLCKSFYSNEME